MPQAKKKAPKKSAQPNITPDMTINEVLQVHPKAANIMQQFGLHCFGCSVNVFETLEEGILGHGMPESILGEMLEALNGDFKKYQKDLDEKGVYLSERGAIKIVEIAQVEGHKNHGIRIKMLDSEGGGCGCKSAAYSMDFEKHAEEGDKILGFHHGVTLFIDKDSFEKMKGSDIDYIETYEAAGFKIENPNVNTAGCGCG
ncbi:MAG: iron-sulfur cluster assembly accessory protein [Candidatus Peregrinibacteria bacterium]|nr:iron-sulfur cluster assembly accessory protein [Candidatus Peregrinibacteria bacterium]